MKQLFFYLLCISFSIHAAGGGKPPLMPQTQVILRSPFMIMEQVVTTPKVQLEETQKKNKIKTAFADLITSMITDFHALTAIGLLKQTPIHNVATATSAEKYAREIVAELAKRKNIYTAKIILEVGADILNDELSTLCAEATRECLNIFVADQITDAAFPFHGIQAGSKYYPQNMQRELMTYGFSEEFCTRWLEQTNALLLPKKE